MQANPSVGLNGYIIAVTVVGGYSFLLASFVIFIVAERESKVGMTTRCMYMFNMNRVMLCTS